MRYLIFWSKIEVKVIEGDNIVNACVASNIMPDHIHSYVKESDIEGMAGCGGCTKSVEDSVICEHDLESYWINGVTSDAFADPYPQITGEEKRKIARRMIIETAITG